MTFSNQKKHVWHFAFVSSNILSRMQILSIRATNWRRKNEKKINEVTWKWQIKNLSCQHLTILQKKNRESKHGNKVNSQIPNLRCFTYVNFLNPDFHTNLKTLEQNFPNLIFFTLNLFTTRPFFERNVKKNKKIQIPISKEKSKVVFKVPKNVPKMVGDF